MELFRLLGTIAINNTEANRDIDETVGKASNSESKITSAFKKIGTAVGTYFAVGKIKQFGESVVSLTAGFEDSMLKVQSLSGASQKEYKQLTEAAQEYGRETAFTSTQVANAMGYMALAGFDTNAILDSTSGMLSLASASGEDLATVTDILTDSMTAFGDSADQAGRYADVLATVQAKTNTTVGALGEAFKYVAPLAGSYGYELEDVSAALGQMANAGVKGSMAGTSLSSIITRLATDAGATSNSLGALGVLTEECGVEFYNADGSARSISDVLVDLCDATKDMTVEQKAEIASTIAGQEAQKGLLAILNQGSDSYGELRDKLADCSGTANDMAENMESGLGGSIRRLQSAFDGFQQKLGEKFKEPLGEAIDSAAGFFNDVLTPAVDTAEQAFDKLAGFVQELARGFQSAVEWGQQHQTTLELIAIAVGTLTTAIVAYNAAQAIKNAGGIVELAQLAALAIAIDAHTIATTISTAATTAFGAAVAFLTSPITIVIAIIGALVAAGVLLYKNWDTVKAKATELWVHLTTAFNSIKETILNVWNGIWDGMKGILNSILGGIETMVNGAVKAINNLIDGLNRIVSAAGKVMGLSVSIPNLNEISLPRLEKGGVLEKGQVGFLEGNGAEAVVPLDQNRAWIRAVAQDMENAGMNGSNEQTQRIIELLEMLIDLLPDTLKEAFAAMKFDVNNREFARLVKAVG